MGGSLGFGVACLQIFQAASARRQPTHVAATVWVSVAAVVCATAAPVVPNAVRNTPDVVRRSCGGRGLAGGVVMHASSGANSAVRPATAHVRNREGAII